MGSDEIARLRRVAFGPGSSAVERADAAAALRALGDRTAAERTAAERAAVVEPASEFYADASTQPAQSEDVLPLRDVETEPESLSGSIDEDSEEPIWRRSIRVGWLIPIVVGSLVVGVVGALGATGRFENMALQGSPEPSATAPGGTSGAVIPGDLQAADSWFERPQSASDIFSLPDLLASDGIQQADVRFALDGGNGWGVWVGRVKDKLCLLIAESDTSNGAGGCFDRDRFALGGAHLGMNGRMAHWYGRGVTADPPDTASANGGAVPQVRRSGRGDVDAANSWFALPATTRDAFPEHGMLGSMGVDQSEVRLVGPEDGSLTKLWVVKQGTTGFCLATVNDSKHTSQSQCATIAEFRISGLSISDRGFAAYWNGESISSSPQ